MPTREQITQPKRPQFLEREVKRLQGEHDAVVAQIEAAKQRPPDKQQAQSDETAAQMKDLAQAEAELAQASAIYSDEYPIIRNLKKKIAILKHAIAGAAPPAAADNAASSMSIFSLSNGGKRISVKPSRTKIASLRLPVSAKAWNGDSKVSACRLSSSRRSRQKPVRPQKMKWFAVAFALAGMIGAGSVAAAEMLDGSIRSSRDLARISRSAFDRDYPLSLYSGRAVSKTPQYRPALRGY